MSAGGVAVLFARADSVYKNIEGCDVYDIERDALTWPGGCPLVAHPPCRAWGRLRHFAKPRDGERELALFAVDKVRAFGGVLEHPAWSSLWPCAGLPMPGAVDKFGGWTYPIDQNWFGHRAKKATFLYIVGCDSLSVPRVPLVLGESSHVIASSSARVGRVVRPECTKAEREHTPPDFAAWLVALARSVVREVAQ